MQALSMDPWERILENRLNGEKSKLLKQDVLMVKVTSSKIHPHADSGQTASQEENSSRQN